MGTGLKDYTFSDPEIQEQWANFHGQAFHKLALVNGKIPKEPNRTKGIEQLIETLMDEQFTLADIQTKAEYFRDIAYAEEIQTLQAQNSKIQSTWAKIEAEAKIAYVTALVAYSKAVLKALEVAVMASQSLLRRCP